MASSPSVDSLVQLGFGFWSAKTLLSAVELGVFTELASGPLTADDLARRLRLQGRGARDFFDALVALQLLERSEDRYANSTHTDRFLDRHKSSYIGDVLVMANERLYPGWGSLTQALRSGAPQSQPFSELGKDETHLFLFLRAMTAFSLDVAGTIAEKFPWRDYRTVFDIGTAEGALPARLLRAHPHLSGGGFDLPAVRPAFERYVEAQGLASRLRFQAGDFTRDALPGADVLVLGHILHALALPEKKMLLRKAWQALPRGGALIVYEPLIDDERADSVFGLLMSLNMLIETEGGFGFTGADCMAWMTAAGFTQSCVEPLTDTHTMVVGIK